MADTNKIAEWFAAFLHLSAVHKGYFLAAFTAVGIAVTYGIKFARVVLKGYRWKKEREKNKLFNSCYPLDVVKEASQFYVRPKAVIQKADNIEEVITEDLLKYFEKNIFPVYNKYRFHLLLADSGMGKTSLLINLVERSTRLSLRARYRIALLPIKGGGIENEIQAIRDSGRASDTILLLDALDEDVEAKKNKIERLNQLAEWSKDFRKVIITSRAQFFDSDEVIPKENNVPVGDSFHEYTFIRLLPLDKNQIKQILSRRYNIFRFWQPDNFKKRRVALYLTLNLPDITSRPVIISFINDLLPSEQLNKLFKYLFFKDFLNFLLRRTNPLFDYWKSNHEKKYAEFLKSIPSLSLTNIYKRVIWKWIERESMRLKREEREIYQNKLYHVSLAAAILIYFENKQTNLLSISKEQLYEVASEYHMGIDEIDISSRSLLYRTPDGQFIFAHRSILEYFLAVGCFFNNTLCENIILESGWDNFNLFSCDLAVSLKILPLFSRIKNSEHLKICFDKFEHIKHVSYVQVNTEWTTEMVRKVVAFKLKIFCGYFNFRIFLPVNNLIIEGYINILKYYAYVLKYDLNEDTLDLIKFILKKLPDPELDERALNDFTEVLSYYQIHDLPLKLIMDNTDDHVKYNFYFIRESILRYCQSTKLPEEYLNYGLEVYHRRKANKDEFKDYISQLCSDGYYYDAIERYDEYHEYHPFDFLTVRNIARCYREIGDLEMAKALYYLGTGDQDNTLAITEYVHILFEQNLFVEAEACLFRFSTSKNAFKLEPWYAEQVYTYKSKAEGFSLLNKLIKKASTYSARNKLANAYFNIGEYTKAIDLVEANLCDSEHNFSDTNFAGIIHSKLKNYRLALQYHLQAYEELTAKGESMEKWQNNNTYRWNIAVGYHNLGDLEKAADFFEQLTVIYRQNDDMELVADTFFECKRFESAFFKYCSLWVITKRFYFFYKLVACCINGKLVAHYDRVRKMVNEYAENDSYHGEYYEKAVDEFGAFLQSEQLINDSESIVSSTLSTKYFPGKYSNFFYSEM